MRDEIFTACAFRNRAHYIILPTSECVYEYTGNIPN